MHYEYSNIYSFLKNIEKITLAPLSPSLLNKSKPQHAQNHSDLFLSFSNPLLKATYHEFKAFKEWILTSQEESEAPSPSHPLAVALLERFAHVFLEDIP